MAECVSRELEWSFVKAGPRKSEKQPHVWFGCDAQEPRIVLKFAGAGPAQRSAQTKIEREAEFLAAVQKLSLADPLRDRVPELLAEGTVEGQRFVATPFDAAPVATAWMAHAFAEDGRGLLGWLDARLEWLRNLQEHEELRRLLRIADGERLCHGDYSHYNFLGTVENAPRVVDWEDWHGSAQTYHDALHVAVMPTIGSRDPEAALLSFRRHWIEGSAWSAALWQWCEGRLGDLDLSQALARYLDARIEREESGAAHVIDLFTRCRDELQAHSA